MIRLKWKYVWPYLVFIASIGILVMLNESAIESSSSSNNHFAQTINLAGRQRMLSQRLVTHVLLPEGTGNDAFSNDLQLWDSIHYTLQSEDERYSLKQLTHSEIQQLFKSLNPIQAKLHQELTRFQLHPEQEEALRSSILNDQKAYLAIMDRIVAAYEQEAAYSFGQVSDKQIMIVALSAVVLILEILVLIIPYHRKLIKAFRQLKEQKIKLEEQNEEIEQQNNRLHEQNAELDKLHRTEELTLKGINAGVWNWDIGSGREEWSDRFFTLLGYEPGEIPATFDTFLHRLLHPDDILPVQEAISAHLQDNSRYRLNVRMQHKDGTYRWFETAGQAARDNLGQPVQMAGSIIDVHEKVNNRHQLEALNQTKDKLFAIIAHDLRAPLASLRSLLDVQESDIISRNEFMDYLRIVKEHTEVLSQSLDNLLHWASGQMQGFTHNAQLTDAAEVVQAIYDFYRAGAAQKNINLTLDAPGRQFIHADKDHLLLIVRNMVNNAIKFTGTGGSIKMSVATHGGHVDITIADTGIGMDAATIQRIMNGSLQHSIAGTNYEKGLGLGLSLSIDMIRENNGTMLIESVAGKGSSFIIRFAQA